MKKTVFVFAAVLAISSMGAATASQTDVLGFYPLNTTSDFSGDNNDLSTSGGVTVGGATGFFGSSTNFDGTDDQLTSNSTHSYTGNFSVSIYVNPDVQASSFRIAAGTDDSTNGWSIGQDNSNNWAWNMRTGSGGTQSVKPDTTIQTGQWYHLVGIYNGTHQILYVNGTVVGTKALSSHNVADDPTNIGNNGPGFDQDFDGQIDSVRVIDETVNESQVENLQKLDSLDNTSQSTGGGNGPGKVEVDISPGFGSTLNNSESVDYTPTFYNRNVSRAELLASEENFNLTFDNLTSLSRTQSSPIIPSNQGKSYSTEWMAATDAFAINDTVHYFIGARNSTNGWTIVWAKAPIDDPTNLNYQDQCNPVFEPDGDSFDAYAVEYPAVVGPINGAYYMYYKGFSDSSFSDNSLGLAKSTDTDFCTWSRVQNTPVVSNTKGTAGVDLNRSNQEINLVINDGDSFDYANASFSNPADVTVRDDTFMTPPTGGNIREPRLLNNGFEHEIFYTNEDDSGQAHASTDDFQSVQYNPDNPVLTPSGSGFDSNTVRTLTPFEKPFNDTLRFVYAGTDGGDWETGMAEIPFSDYMTSASANTSDVVNASENNFSFDFSTLSSLPDWFELDVELSFENSSTEGALDRTIVEVIDNTTVSNSPPSAAISANTTDIEVNETVAFDFSGSSDSDGTIDQYDFDPDGDSTYEFTATGPTFDYQYDSSGTFSATVKVTDNASATDTASTSISVSKPKKYYIKNTVPAVALGLTNNPNFDPSQQGVEENKVEEVTFGPDLEDRAAAALKFNFSSNISAENISTESSRSKAKAALNISGTVSNLQEKSLLVPRVNDSGKVHVCPDSDTISSTGLGCQNGYNLSTGNSKNGVSLSEVTFNNSAYYKATGVQGTGGVEVSTSSDSDGGGGSGGSGGGSEEDTGTDGSENTTSGNGTADFHVEVVDSFQPRAATMQAAPGTRATEQIEVLNNGSQEVTVDLSCMGANCRYVALESSGVSLKPGNLDRVRVEATIPVNYTKGQSYSFDIQASAEGTTRTVDFVAKPSTLWTPLINAARAAAGDTDIQSPTGKGQPISVPNLVPILLVPLALFLGVGGLLFVSGRENRRMPWAVNILVSGAALVAVWAVIAFA